MRLNLPAGKQAEFNALLAELDALSREQAEAELGAIAPVLAEHFRRELALRTARRTARRTSGVKPSCGCSTTPRVSASSVPPPPDVNAHFRATTTTRVAEPQDTPRAAASTVPAPPDVNARIRAAAEAPAAPKLRPSAAPIRYASNGVPLPPDLNALIRQGGL